MKYLATILTVLVAIPALAGWIPGPVTQSPQVTYDQSFSYTYTAAGYSTTHQDVTECVRPTVEISSILAKAEVLDCPAADSPRSECVSKIHLPNPRGYEPGTGPFSIGTFQKGYAMVRVTDATPAGEVTLTCHGTMNAYFNATDNAWSTSTERLTASEIHEACATGVVKGGGYDSTTGLYDWTCATYPWSSEFGGVDSNGYSDYTTPTTRGGNSWKMTCTGAGTATGSPPEQVVCIEAGEVIHMYVMADWMLAQDNTKKGGKVYVPSGIYHDKGCGQSSSQTANSCPVLNRYPTHYQRRIQSIDNITFVGEFRDNDGPLQNGRTGTYYVFDHGNDAAACDGLGGGGSGAIDCGLDPADDVDFGAVHNGRPQWALRVGYDTGVNICAMSSGDTACVARANEHLVGMSSYSRTSVILGNSNQTASTRDLCIDDTLATYGTCSGDRRVQCTVDDGTRPTATTGGCSALGLGTCETIGDALQTDLTAGGEYSVVMSVKPPDHYGDPTNVDGQSVVWSGWGKPASVGATCSTTGQLWRFENRQTSSTDVHWPLPVSRWDTAAQGTTRPVYVIDAGRFNNQSSGFESISVMPANWIGRDDDASGTANQPQDCLASGDPACDEAEALALGGGYGGGFYNGALYKTGGGDSFSSIDGAHQGFLIEFHGNVVAEGQGLMTDASAWSFRDNLFRDWDCLAKSCISTGFNPDSQFVSNKFKNVAGERLFNVKGPGAYHADIEIESSAFVYGIVEVLGGTHNSTFENFRGYGNRGPIIAIRVEDDADIWALDFRNFNFRAHNPTSANPNLPVAYLIFTDLNGTTGNKAGIMKDLNFEGIYFEGSFVNGTNANACGIFLEGGTGAEGTAANGLGRSIDDQRHELSFKDVHMEIGWTNGGSHLLWCLGNSTSTENEADERAGDIWASVGGMPAWVGLYENGVRFPDNPLGSMAAADVPDCGNMIQGTVVQIHDDTSAGACTDAGADGNLDGGGTATSVCKCAAAGTWSTF